MALRVLVEKIGLPTSAVQPAPMDMPKQEKADYCNRHWQQEFQEVCLLHAVEHWPCFQPR